MTRHQQARRYALWRGSFIVLTGTTIWMLASALAGHLTA
jgi:hypothetical protein